MLNLLLFFANGRVPKWPNGADCKSAGLRLPWFESKPYYHVFFVGWEEVNSVIQMRMKKGESVERALKRLKKVMDKEGLLKQLRNNRYYEKPCVKLRLKSARARIRLSLIHI